MKDEYKSLGWPILRGVVFVVGLCGFASFLAGFLHLVNWELGTIYALGVFVLATCALIAMTPASETLPATVRDFGSSGWLFFSYCVVLGLGFNWACVFLWFSRRYAFFSVPVVGVTGLIVTSCTTIALLIVRMTGGNWRIALAAISFAVVVPAAIVLRLGLLR